jgi:hypothetical protein
MSKEVCNNCDGDGWYYDYLGGCGDPECCDGPLEVKCHMCDNDYEADSDTVPQEAK